MSIWNDLVTVTSPIAPPYKVTVEYWLDSVNWEETDEPREGMKRAYTELLKHGITKAGDETAKLAYYDVFDTSNGTVVKRGLHMRDAEEYVNKARLKSGNIWLGYGVARPEKKAKKAAAKKPRGNPDDEVIFRYTRAQGLADGVLVDMTEWGSAKSGFHGGFAVPVAMTSHLWGDIDKKVRLQDTRGRAHDVLWMASLAVRGGQKRGIIGQNGGRVLFDVLLQVGRKRKQRLAVDLSGGDNGEPVVTIGYPEDF